MPKPFDVTTKVLLESDPAAWLDFVGLPKTGPVSVIDADLSTVLAEADKVIRVGGPAPWLTHIEFQASYDRILIQRVLTHNVLQNRRHNLPVQSVVILLRKEADGPDLTGRHVATRSARLGHAGCATRIDPSDRRSADPRGDTSGVRHFVVFHFLLDGLTIPVSDCETVIRWSASHERVNNLSGRVG
jgi:hypothetical protein